MKNPHYMYAQAFRSYKNLAAQGHPEAQRLLGMMYENGQGVPKNYLEASRWYEKAASAGDMGGVVRLGLLHANGRGIPKNFVEGCKLFLIAKDMGYPNAQALLDQLTPKMTEEQLAEANALAGEWAPVVQD
ncbi:tetratricopeptide repeat protein [Desulfatibacillum aliphaticivorans]|uniref:tetratricopeptide repeat protein n=1 Tax=Desulfatibacillum aliphaticivorans TaxID=218208 RepID=UPI00041E3A36|nr:tetratricopeptide repeat protein [Desulfatibacillum aliphaticivorans]